jgi:hypothetical protein
MSPWTLVQYLRVDKNSIGLCVGVLVKHLGSTLATRLIVRDSLDLDCLELFPSGTIFLMQIKDQVLVDWTLAPRMGPNKPPDDLPGESWKHADD